MLIKMTLNNFKDLFFIIINNGYCDFLFFAQIYI